jgi:hypothetical protein
VSCCGAAVLVLCHDDLGDGRELAERVRPRLVPPTAVLVLDLHGLRRLRPAAGQVLAELAHRARRAAIAVRVLGDDERVLAAVRAACAHPALADTVDIRNTTTPAPPPRAPLEP